MPNISRKVYYMIAASAVLVVFNFCTCYAKTTTFEDIKIKCSEDAEKATWHQYKGKLNTRLILTTKGIQEEGRTELVDYDAYWREIDHEIDSPPYRSKYSSSGVNILAACKSSKKYIRFVNMWPPNRTLTCEKGEAILICMLAPNDQDPNKYQYIATLTTITDDEENEEVIDDMLTNGIIEEKEPLAEASKEFLFALETEF